MANNPFSNAFQNYESSGNQRQLGSSASGGFNPNTMQNNYAPWTPPNSPYATPGPAIPTTPFGSYGGGASPPSQTPAPSTPSTPPNIYDVLRNNKNQLGGASSGSGATGLLQSRPDIPYTGGIDTLTNGAIAEFAAESGGAIPPVKSFDDGGDTGSGGYASDNSNIDSSSNDNYTVNVDDLTGVQQALQDSRDAVTMPQPPAEDQAPIQVAGDFGKKPLPMNPAATSPMPGQGGTWDPNSPPPGPQGGPAQPLNISPATPPSKLGTFGKLADLGGEGEQFAARGGAIQSFADGGSVGTKAYQGGGPASPAIPEEPDDDDAATASPGAPSPGGTPTPGLAGANPQLLMRYAQGADAVSPDEAQAAEDNIDPHGVMDPVARRMKAVAQEPDKHKRIGLLQHHRRAFNVKRHAARAALDRGHHAEAVRLANSAMQHVLNGHSVHITPNGSKGVHIHSRNLVGGQ